MSNNTFISFIDSFTNTLNYNHDIQTQSEIIDQLKKFIEEINISKVLPDFLLQLKVQRRRGWNGRGIKNFPSSGALK
jgi:predicted XRE-type DNA-binding protein